MNILVTYLLFLVANSVCEEFTVTPITTGSGLYYEKIGEALLSNKNWQFVTSVDYRGYLLFYEYLSRQANQIYTFCETYPSKDCDDRYNSIQTQLGRIEETDQSMANFLGVTRSKRVKRFWAALGSFLGGLGSGFIQGINGGGGVDLSQFNNQINDLRNSQHELSNQLQAQRTLFVIDSEKKQFQIDWLTAAHGKIERQIGQLETTFQVDSKEKEKQIKELRQMLSETDKKLKMQEEIQKKLVTDVDKIQKKLVQVDSDIKEINQRVANNSKRVDALELKVKLNTISIDFNFLLSQFETEQRTLYGVIKNANKGDLDPYILTPLNLVEMLENIQPNLPEGTRFPYYPTIKNANKLYNIIKPSVYLHNSTIIFILNIPLTIAKTFSIHKITSLPVAVSKDKFVFVLPKEAFLLIDNNHQEYMLLRSNDFRDFCTELDAEKYVCKQIQQLSTTHSSTDCELVLFNFAREIPQSCDKRVMHLQSPTFLQLQQIRTWIYAVPNTEHVIINCDNARSVVALNGSGFIRLHKECTIHLGSSFLTSLIEFTKPVASNFTLPLDLRSFVGVSDWDNFEIKISRPRQVILPFDFDELDTISMSLETTTQNSYTIYYILIAVLGLVVALCVFLVYQKIITLDKVINVFHFYTSRIPNFSNPPEAPAALPGNELDSDKLQMKITLNKKIEGEKNISVLTSPSTTDPESEYLTVQFKVKKNANAEQDKFNHTPNAVKSGDEHYLDNLRKMKPKAPQM